MHHHHPGKQQMQIGQPIQPQSPGHRLGSLFGKMPIVAGRAAITEHRCFSQGHVVLDGILSKRMICLPLNFWWTAPTTRGRSNLVTGGAHKHVPLK